MRSYYFDLDGTVSNSEDGVVNAIIYALEKLGVPIPDRAVMRTFIGPPLLDSFRGTLGLSEDDAVRALEYYRIYYSARGIFENTPYDGVEELLSYLHGGGDKIYLATSKPEVYSEKIIDNFGFTKYFDAQYGATTDNTRSEKTDVLRYALEKSRPDYADSFMVGDRLYDMRAARTLGIRGVGALWGFGLRAELMDSGAEYCAATPRSLKTMLSGQKIPLAFERVKNGGSLDFCYAVRFPIFIIEQGFSYDGDADDSRSHHVIGYRDGLPIAAARIVPPHDKNSRVCHIGRICVAREWRGYNYGADLVRYMLNYARELGYVKAEIDAQKKAAEFYRKLGFIATAGAPEMFEEGVAHLKMSYDLT